MHISKMYSEKIRSFYNNVTAQTISESGKYLFIGNSFGDIFVLDIEYLCDVDENDGDDHDDVYPKVMLFAQGEDKEINSLCFYKDTLIVGTTGVIFGLVWDEENAVLCKERKWHVLIEMHKDATEVPDINSLWLRETTNKLFAGCGDNNLYQIDLEKERIVQSYRGHTDYVHDITGNDAGQIFSASEDGTVRLWSEKEKHSVAALQPSTNSDLIRPEYGHWIGAVAANDRFLVCGGGPKYAIYYLPTLGYITELPFPGKGHTAEFVSDHILIAGEHNHIHQFSMNADLVSSPTVNATAVFSVVWQLKPFKFMSVAGYSNNLDIFEDFHIPHGQIPLYGNIGSEKPATKQIRNYDDAVEMNDFSKEQPDPENEQQHQNVAMEELSKDQKELIGL